MARNVVKRDAVVEKSGAALESGVPVDKAPMLGGTSGAPPDPNVASHVIHGLNDVQPAREQPEPTQDGPVQKFFKVVGGPEFVMYDGQRVRMMHGKIIADNSVDLDLLRRQGVKLEEQTNATL